MNAQKSALTLFREFVTKAIFTVGLCTTAYYSVVKAHQTFFQTPLASSTTVGEPTSLRDKVDALNQNQHLGTLPEGQFAVQPIKAGLNKIVEAPAAAAPTANPASNTIIQAAVDAAANASPSPSPGDAQVQAQEEVAQNPYPQQYYPNGYNPYGQNGDGSGADSASKDKKDSKSASSDTPPSDQYGIGGQLIVPPKPQVIGGIDIAASSGNTVNVTSNLTSQDIQWLTSLGIKATIPTTDQYPVTGSDSNGAIVSTPPYPASASWWNFDYGLLDTGSTFTVRPSTSGGAPIEMSIAIQTQTQNKIPVPIAFSIHPNDANAKNDVMNNGQSVRVYTFHAPDQAVNDNKDNLLGMTVTLTVVISGSTPTLLSGSFVFNRADVKTSRTPWAVPRAPASTNDWIIADQLPFVMKLEKAQ